MSIYFYNDLRAYWCMAVIDSGADPGFFLGGDAPLRNGVLTFKQQ